MTIFLLLYLLLIPILEEFYWRIFLIKSLPEGSCYTFVVHFFYGLLNAILINYIFDW